VLRRKNLCLILIIFSAPVFTTQGFAASFYQCKSPDGKTSFSDKPCPSKSTTTNTGKLNSSRLIGTTGEKEFSGKNAAPNQQSIFIFRAKFSKALQSLAPLRMSITRYYMDSGQWPKNLEVLGFRAKTMQSEFISSTRIKKNGKIVALLKPQLGEHKMIVLDPKPAMGNTSLDWQCSSNFPSALLGGREMGLCDSREIY